MFNDQWMVYDAKKDVIKYVTADDQKHAIEKAYEKFGVLPQRTDHARPRNCTGELMSIDEFKDYMS